MNRDISSVERWMCERVCTCTRMWYVGTGGVIKRQEIQTQILTILPTLIQLCHWGMYLSHYAIETWRSPKGDENFPLISEQHCPYPGAGNLVRSAPLVCDISQLCAHSTCKCTVNCAHMVVKPHKSLNPTTMAPEKEKKVAFSAPNLEIPQKDSQGCC